MKSAIIMSALLAMASTAAAQQPPDSVRFRLRPIEVSVMRATTVDTRTAAAVTAVPARLIQDGQLTIGLDEALGAVPGLLVNNRYNFSLGSRIAIRGIGARAAFGVRGVRVLMDGIPLTMPDGQANLNNVDLGAAGRIEVARGPVSSLYGNAAGGVIAVHTEEPPATGFGGELRYTAATLGRNGLGNTGKSQVKLGGRSGRADYLLSASMLSVEGAREYSEAEQRLLNARVRVSDVAGGRLTFLLNAADAPTAQNPGSLPRDSFNTRPRMAWPRNIETGAGEEARQVQGGVTYDRAFGRSHGSISFYGAGRALENPLPFAYIALDRLSGGMRVGGTTIANLLDRELELSAGADIEFQSDDRREFNNVNGAAGSDVRRDQTDRVQSVGPFVQLRLPLSSKLELSGGLRYDRIAFRTEDNLLADGRDDSGQRTLSAFSPRLGLLFAFSDASSAYATVSTAFQTPTTTELINAPPALGEPAPAGFNDSLEPQHARNFEIGLKGTLAERVRYELAAYHMNVSNTLVPFQVPQAEAREFFRNSGRTRHRGLEVAAAVRATDRVTLDGAYTYSQLVFRDDGLPDQDFEGNAVPGVPPHHAFFRLHFAPLARLGLEVENEYTSAYFASDANDEASRTPDANVLNVRANFDLRLGATQVQPFFAVANLFDRHYASSVVINATGARYFEPAPGRNLVLGTRIRFGGWAGS